MATFTCVMLFGPQAWRVSSSFVAGSLASIVTFQPHCDSEHIGQLHAVDELPLGHFEVKVAGTLSGFNSSVNTG